MFSAIDIPSIYSVSKSSIELVYFICENVLHRDVLLLFTNGYFNLRICNVN